MLILTRRAGERVLIGNEIVVTVLAVHRGQVRLGISAPRECRILRGELADEVRAENRDAAAHAGGPVEVSALLEALPRPSDDQGAR
ncbi:MAG: carbon storage regulator CsrA [Planctomycetota bacterium]|nr:carbon storage regulator CsrA [Planctomycetota bacterium]MDW8372928.1 carbon storage regulator CsrA [Planctomycetota bacterium]